MENRNCLFCETAFTPNKYSPGQKICSGADCQKKRQWESMRQWRKKNPNYFKYDDSKGLEWLELQRKRSKIWRDKNPEKVRSYRTVHSRQYRDYMREYMRQYRQKKKGQSAFSGQTTPDIPNA